MINEGDKKVLLNELEVLLSEKRTYYSILRTGLAVITVPPTIIIFLLATSSHHGLFSQLYIGSITVISLSMLSVGGAATAYQAKQKIRRINKLINAIEEKDDRINEIII